MIQNLGEMLGAQWTSLLWAPVKSTKQRGRAGAWRPCTSVCTSSGYSSHGCRSQAVAGEVKSSRMGSNSEHWRQVGLQLFQAPRTQQPSTSLPQALLASSLRQQFSMCGPRASSFKHHHGGILMQIKFESSFKKICFKITLSDFLWGSWERTSAALPKWGSKEWDCPRALLGSVLVWLSYSLPASLSVWASPVPLRRLACFCPSLAINGCPSLDVTTVLSFG